MNGSNWQYLNKGLIIILSVFVLATITSIVFLGSILLRLDSLISKNGKGVSTALVLQDLFIDIDDAETSARGYIITGDEQYLSTYKKSVQQLPADMKTVSADEDLDLSLQQVVLIKSLVDQKVKIMDRTVEARKSGGEDAARAIMLEGTGSQLMSQIRTIANNISSGSLKDIKQRQEMSHSSLRQALSVAVAVVVFIFGICIVLSWYFQRSILRERALESTKNEFLSLASHQLRTPATNVKQYIGLLLDGYLGDLTVKQRDALRIANKNNELEIRIMNDLLDVAKLDLKRIQLRKQSVNVVSIVRQVVKSYEKVATDKNQTLTLQAPPQLIAEVDRTYFKGVLEKLIDNAIRYSRNDTRILVKIHALENRGMFEVIVKDRGAGIKKREVPKLFKKFSRLTNEFSANSEGSGLGLYWVKQIMDLHGGTVEVISKEGQGSKFIARSPLK